MQSAGHRVGNDHETVLGIVVVGGITLVVSNFERDPVRDLVNWTESVKDILASQKVSVSESVGVSVRTIDSVSVIVSDTVFDIL